MTIVQARPGCQRCPVFSNGQCNATPILWWREQKAPVPRKGNGHSPEGEVHPPHRMGAAVPQTCLVSLYFFVHIPYHVPSVAGFTLNGHAPLKGLTVVRVQHAQQRSLATNSMLRHYFVELDVWRICSCGARPFPRRFPRCPDIQRRPQCGHNDVEHGSAEFEASGRLDVMP